MSYPKEMKSWRGLCFVVLGSMASGALAAGPFKVTDLAPVLPVGNGKVQTGLLWSVSPNGSLTGRFGAGAAGGGMGIYHPQRGWSWALGRFGMGGNSNGEAVHTGDTVFGVRTQQSGGKKRNIDGSDVVVQGIPGYDFVNSRAINDAGVIVGHFSMFVTDPWDFRGGKPFYRRGSQTWTPYDLGTVLKVNRNGMALFAAGNVSGEELVGLWSPETGPVPMPSLAASGTQFGDPYNDVLDVRDLNEKNEVLTAGRSSGRNTLRVHSATGSFDIVEPIPFDSSIVGFFVGGMNNLSQYTMTYWVKDASGQTSYHWYLHSNGAWTDMTSSILSQLPAGMKLEQVNDIDDYGRVYGMATLADGSKTVLRVETVPEPATLAALGLGALLLKRRTRKNGILRGS